MDRAECAETVIDLQRQEIERLRADLAAKADVHTQVQMELSDKLDKARADLAAANAREKIARETLIEALEYIDDAYNELAIFIGNKLARIEAALKGDQK